MRRRIWRAATVGAVIAAGLVPAFGDGAAVRTVTAAARSQEPQVVSLVDNRFVSDFVIVTVGGTVTFRNDEADPTVLHDVYSEDGMLLSPVIASGESWSYTFGSEGFWRYYCSFHPGMEADILVVAAE